MTPGKTITVPLTIQIGEKRMVCGIATVTGDEVIAYLYQHVHTVGDELAELIAHNVISGVNLNFVMKPRVRKEILRSDNFAMYQYVYPTEETQ